MVGNVPGVNKIKDSMDIKNDIKNEHHTIENIGVLFRVNNRVGIYLPFRIKRRYICLKLHTKRNFCKK